MKRTSKRHKTLMASQTKKLGEALGRSLKAGDVVALEGNLGAGKTTFVKGAAEGLGVTNPDDVLSPTFTMIHEYSGRIKIYHIDWYRLDAVRGQDALLSQECFDDNAVTFVEWPERGRALLPPCHIRVQIRHEGGDTRTVEIGRPL
jgi:tRNA threonylcarbamoyladenosine biosynthesis protein TsaE